MNLYSEIRSWFVKNTNKRPEDFSSPQAEVPVNPASIMRDFQTRIASRPTNPLHPPDTAAKFTFTGFRPDSKPLQNEENKVPGGAASNTANSITIQVVKITAGPSTITSNEAVLVP